MTTNSVPMASMLGMIFSFLIAVGVPIALCIIAKVKLKAKLSSFFIGAATFVLFALVLEQILHVIVLKNTTITENIWLYALYGGLAAGVFEETGRYLAMKFVMKKNLDKQNALSYGIGHGGIEAILIVGLTEINNLIISYMVNSGQVGVLFMGVDESLTEAVTASISQFWEMPSYQFYLAGVERLIAIVLHIGLSYLVYRAVKDKKIRFYFIAVALHFLVDAVTVMLSQFVSVIVIELVLLVMVAAITFVTARMYKKESAKKQ